MKNVLGSAFLAILLAGPATAHADAAQKTIRDMHRAWEFAYNTGDSGTLAELYSAEGALYPPGSKVIAGRRAIAEFWQAVMESGLSKVMLEPSEIEVLGNTAIDIGRFTGTVPGEEGASSPVTGRYIIVYRIAEDGGWRFHREIWNTGQ